MIICSVCSCPTGMSTAPEVLVASHCGMRVFGLSLITNKVVKSYEDSETTNHETILEVSKMRSEMLQKLITEIIIHMDINNNQAWPQFQVVSSNLQSLWLTEVPSLFILNNIYLLLLLLGGQSLLLNTLLFWTKWKRFLNKKQTHHSPNIVWISH